MSQKKRKSSELPLHNKDEKVAKTVVVSLEDWEKFERFREHLSELEDITNELRRNWRDHLRYLTEEFQFVDHDFDGLEETVRRVPRMLKFITTGHFPPMHQDDDDLDWYDDQYINRAYNRYDRQYDDFNKRSYHPKKKLVVIVKIEDVSTNNDL